jgi:DNA-binding CsgD family transcriptional regulator
VLSLAFTDLVEAVRTAETAEAASARFFEGARVWGATYLQTRLYRRPEGPLTAEKHLAAGGIVLRLSPPAWAPGNPAFDYVCLQRNPLLKPVRQGVTRFAFEDYAPRWDPAWGEYWEALSEAGIGRTLCAASYGRGRAVASLHLGFSGPDLDQEASAGLQLAGVVLTETLMRFAPPAADGEVLTPRERAVLTWIADGKSDWETACILGLSEPTVRFHLANARRKLGAVNRVQAVARFVAAGEA